MSKLKEQIDNTFTYHPPMLEDVPKFNSLRNTAKDFAHMIDALCPDGTDKTEALKKLQECVMWANAAIARK